jgi:hypothetical protein
LPADCLGNTGASFIDNTLSWGFGNYINSYFFSNIMTSNNCINVDWLNQTLLYGSNDSSSLFFFNSALTFEDFGLEFSPAVKEIMVKTYSYSSYMYNQLLTYSSCSSFNNFSSLFGDSDLFVNVFNDQSCRFYNFILNFSHQSNYLYKCLGYVSDDLIFTDRTNWVVSQLFGSVDSFDGCLLPNYSSFATTVDLLRRSLLGGVGLSVTLLSDNYQVFDYTSVFSSFSRYDSRVYEGYNSGNTLSASGWLFGSLWMDNFQFTYLDVLCRISFVDETIGGVFFDNTLDLGLTTILLDKTADVVAEYPVKLRSGFSRWLGFFNYNLTRMPGIFAFGLPVGTDLQCFTLFSDFRLSVVDMGFRDVYDSSIVGYFFEDSKMYCGFSS